ncbi:tRNA pseudouridine(38-40) synthase TruA [Clostridium felsineum]|uniref:tRNA pseudouridine synthase A n=1 Tax=Clostridium felsineum TaxID=36839 RepID=A0A1S8KXZ6_9CLOT|nr:tRNA pseudouridine(38-40) synthase TruA [Clostridium felsineum]URZ08181.1 tRNA pseudouridine synthase A [Clostridium felsineum]URZ13212.1 tRNA pseudouridine synthase A [Clostridium felsineum]
MKNVKLTLEYDGTNYCGWQRQSNVITVQEEVEKRIGEIVGDKVDVIGCSRTDSGVHAKAYTCNFKTNSVIPPEKFYLVLNSVLPDDIVALNSKEVPIDFHSRFNSKGKMYSYTILNRSERPAINRNYVYQYGHNLDCDLMREAAKYILGTHDFTSFKSTGSKVKSNIRTIYEAKIIEDENKVIFYITGDGFLYNMVRIIVGTLLEVGEKKIIPLEVKTIVEAKDRTKAGRVVPAKGLCLEKVMY